MRQLLNSLCVCIAGTTLTADALHVTQWQDSMYVEPETFLILTNSNEQNFLAAAVDSKTQIQQDLNVELVSKELDLSFFLVRKEGRKKLCFMVVHDLNFGVSLLQTNNYLNQKFDLILFDDDDKEGMRCYMGAVAAKKWDTDCQFSDKTKVFLNTVSFSDWFDGLDQIDELSGTIVIDNTKLPIGGAYSRYPITTMVTTRTDFKMQYNIKDLTIYCGLAVLLMLFVVFGQIYLYCKLRRDTNAKKSKLADDYNVNYAATSKLLPKTE